MAIQCILEGAWNISKGIISLRDRKHQFKSLSNQPPTVWPQMKTCHPVASSYLCRKGSVTVYFSFSQGLLWIFKKWDLAWESAFKLPNYCANQKNYYEAWMSNPRKWHLERRKYLLVLVFLPPRFLAAAVIITERWPNPWRCNARYMEWISLFFFVCLKGNTMSQT